VGRGTQTVQTTSRNTPAPTSSNGAQVPLSGISSIVNSVFKHKGARTPTPPPAPKPSRGVIVAPVSSATSVAAADLANATHELYFALGKHYNAQMTGIAANPAQSIDQICGADGPAHPGRRAGQDDHLQARHLHVFRGDARQRSRDGFFGHGRRKRRGRGVREGPSRQRLSRLRRGRSSAPRVDR
jgi:hypothetical protein